MFQGNPTPGAIVEFIPQDEARSKERKSSLEIIRAYGKVDDKGEFSMISHVPEGAKPGVEPGTYVVTISWTKPLDPTDKDSGPGPELLPARYQDPLTSGLKFEVQSGSNVVPPITVMP
ncbi:MAG: hypothetical protein JWM11_6702 [Planctomycetaceae bacterium]|nr:hypothetical protein [Planctomycetaceae bacterium]